MKIKYVFFIMIFILLITSSVYSDKSYQMSRVQIKAQLHTDGSMEVTESRTYDFEGKFSYAFRTFPKPGPVTFSAFRVTEGSSQYKLSDSEEPGTFWINDKGNTTEVRWFFRAEDEKRTFLIWYTAQDAVIRYKDAAVLHYQFISEEWNKPSWNVYLELYPPIPLSKQEVQVWSHGPLWMGSYIQEDGTITGSCKKLPAYTYFDIRALYPLEVFSESRYVNQAVKENILQQEARWAKEANQKRETLIAEDQARKKRWAQGKWIMGVLTLIGFIGWWSLHRRYGIRSSLKLPVPKISPNIPSDTPPALLDYLLHDRQIYGGALMGTLFDLARRGILNLRHEEREVKGFKRLFKEKSTQYWDIKRDVWEKKAAQLTEYENSILEFLFDTIGQGKDSIEIKLIQKKRTAFMKFFREWKKEVKRRAEEREWFDKQSLKGRNYSLILSCVMLLLLIPGCILYGPWGLLLAFSSLILFILSLFIAHRTSKGEQLFREWKSLKKYLIKHHYRYADKQHVLDQIDDYLIYGTVLGLTQKMFKELADFIPSDNHASYLPWFIYHGRPGAAFSSASFAASFSTSVAATTSAMSSASGAGGGASGGAGGASSGGGGAG